MIFAQSYKNLSYTKDGKRVATGPVQIKVIYSKFKE